MAIEGTDGVKAAAYDETLSPAVELQLRTRIRGVSNDAREILVKTIRDIIDTHDCISVEVMNAVIEEAAKYGVDASVVLLREMPELLEGLYSESAIKMRLAEWRHIMPTRDTEEILPTEHEQMLVISYLADALEAISETHEKG